MSSGHSRFFRYGLAGLSGLLLLALAGGGWGYGRLRASRPQLDGTARIAGLGAAVTVERDALGVPTIRGATRLDVARALGWLHAQDRFFQMDLMRRRAAGELAELFGAKAVPLDRAARMHDFRRFAETAWSRLPPEQRALATAYADGVNAGLAALSARPWEYYALRTAPRPWTPLDSVLVGYAMMLDLQDPGAYERSYTTLRHVLGETAADFFAPLVAPDDAALDGSTAPLGPIPAAEVLDLRPRIARAEPPPAADTEPLTAGSNSLALAGAHTANGAGLLANDMHLELRVPNIWYRASLAWDDAGTKHRVTGVTLPGQPVMVAGSNGHVAWGFTNADADVSDLVVVETTSLERTHYKRGTDLVALQMRRGMIAIKGGSSVPVETPWTEWGPLVGEDEEHRPLALAWCAHSADAIDFTLGELETAPDAAAAVAIARRCGVPVLNFLVADDRGAIAWTIAGRLPQRVGYSGRYAVSRAFLDRRWDGFLPPEKYPVIRTPASGRLSTANQRQLGGAALALLGDGGYEDPYRARQVRDDLAALERATPRDLLAVELDDRALFLARWRELALRVLTPEATAQQKSRAEFRRLLETWEGRASVDSVSYRLVRGFRSNATRLTLTPIFARCAETDAAFSWRRFRYEPALWALFEKQPPHLLDPRFARWDDLLLAAVDETIAQTEVAAGPLARATWGRRNTAHIQHPFSRSLPGWLARFLDLPADELAGDSHMPRVTAPSFGASERFAVAPGHEAEGLFHMPGGQSGHPLSPFYRAGHAAWVHGDPTPFLPGPAEHRLTLTP